MKALPMFIEHCLIEFPLAIGIATISYAVLIWFALSKKDFVKASVWHRTSGFSIEARSTQARRQRKSQLTDSAQD